MGYEWGESRFVSGGREETGWRNRSETGWIDVGAKREQGRKGEKERKKGIDIPPVADNRHMSS